jgi:hypothetical protein
MLFHSGVAPGVEELSAGRSHCGELWAEEGRDADRARQRDLGMGRRFINGRGDGPRLRAGRRSRKIVSWTATADVNAAYSVGTQTGGPESAGTKRGAKRFSCRGTG